MLLHGVVKSLLCHQTLIAPFQEIRCQTTFASFLVFMMLFVQVWTETLQENVCLKLKPLPAPRIYDFRPNGSISVPGYGTMELFSIQVIMMSNCPSDKNEQSLGKE